MILAVMGAGVVTVFVKNDTTTTPTARAPEIYSSTPSTTAPTVAPTSSVEASRQLAARSGVKRAPKGRQVPLLPDSGVGGHPIGLVLAAIGASLAVWVRRSARA